MELIPGRIADDIPAIAAIKLPGDLRTGPKPRPQIGDAIPRFGKCRSYLGHEYCVECRVGCASAHRKLWCAEAHPTHQIQSLSLSHSVNRWVQIQTSLRW